MKIILEQWDHCHNSYGDKGYFRKGPNYNCDIVIWETWEQINNINDPDGEERYELESILKICGKPYNLFNYKTAEALMFKVDLLLLEDERFEVREPFLFPQGETNDSL